MTYAHQIRVGHNGPMTTHKWLDNTIGVST
jgi:hypothetical protein